jgi:hypothetical protein
MSSIVANSTTDTVYIQQVGSLYYYNINNGALVPITTFPITVTNTSADYIYLPIIFKTDLTIYSSTFYFICNSQLLQFGSKTRNVNGSRATITVSGVTNYPGFIQNGTATTNGYNSTSIYNLIINSSSSTLLAYGGWLCQAYFGKTVYLNQVVNCSSNGTISSYSGGIVGAYAGSGENDAVLTIEGCSSTGNILSYGGGIAGASSASGSLGNLTITRCWSSGTINDYSGGITGYDCSSNKGTLKIVNCYSIGAINNYSGGILGSTSGNGGTIYISNSYSRGSIGIYSGGIVGNNAGQGTSKVSINNCYSSGTIATTAGGIVANNYTLENVPVTYCYTSGTMTSPNGGIWAGIPLIGDTNYAEGVNQNLGWQDVHARTTLQGAPPSDSGVISYNYYWCQPNGLNTPYALSTMGYTPYSLVLTTNATSSIIAGQSTPAAVIPGYTYSFFAINNAPPLPGFTINSSTGAITVSNSVAEGYYNIIVYSINGLSYSITTYILRIFTPVATTAIIANGTTDTVYIQQVGSSYYYDINNGALTPITTFPISVQNLSADTTLPIIFKTDLTIVNSNFYFICNSSYLQFGRTDRNSNGSRAIITVSGITNYPGFIQNGTNTAHGYGNTTIYNLIINSSSSTLNSYGGWLCQAFYGTFAQNNTITNCSSNGTISSYSGGIVGAYACSGGGEGNNATLTITGCSSTGTINNYSGGIIGAYCSNNYNDSISINLCWSSGTIDNYSGGITGHNCGSTSGFINCEFCYSTGTINNYSGGIIGSNAAFRGGVKLVTCYSQGSIGNACGGMYGINAGIAGLDQAIPTITWAEGCYSSGTINPSGGGLYGPGYVLSNSTVIYCYVSGIMTSPNGGIWAGHRAVVNFYDTYNYVEGTNENIGWQDKNASFVLYGSPQLGTKYGYNWCQPNGTNTPYALSSMGYTPYVQPLSTYFSNSVIAGQSTYVAFVPGYTYSILAIDNAAPTSQSLITINPSTGSLTTSINAGHNPPSYTYYIIVYSTIGLSYSITNYALTVYNRTTSTTYTIQITLNSTVIFNGYFIVDSNTAAPNILSFYENGNTANLLASPGSYGNNDNTFGSLTNPFDSYGVNITTMSYYAGNYGSNNIPPPNGDGTYNFKNFSNGTGTILNFSQNTYHYTITEVIPPPTPTPIPEPPVVYCPTPIKCRFCYSYKPPGPIEPTCIPVVCTTNQYLSSIAMISSVTNNSTRTIESSLLQAMVKRQQQYIEQQTTNSTIQSTITNAAAINENIFSQLVDLKKQRYEPYQPYIYPVVPQSVVELQMRTANVGVGVPPDTIMNCRGSQFVTT